MSYEKMNFEFCIVSTPEVQSMHPLGKQAGPSSPSIYSGLLQNNTIQIE